MTTVTRFAPSPTGFLHIGGARTALFNWLYAKHTGGSFLLRIEDTDRKRSTPEATQAILDGLNWLGLAWDGPVVSQFERAERHQEIAHTLLASGKAYKCYCSPEELAHMRDEAKATGRPVAYDRRWRDRDPSEAPDGIDPVIRLKSPLEGDTVINDAVQGKVTVPNAQIDDYVLLRADGTPTYMLAVVVDDHDMGVTDVIRGDDHLNNAARQMALYTALEWPLPHYAHIPLIHGPDGAKLSKRHGALGVEAYKDMGYLPDAMRNYLARLGWSHGDDEIFTTEQAIDWFETSAIGTAPARFDFDILAHVNAQYLRQCTSAQLTDMLLPLLVDSPVSNDILRGRLLRSLDAVKERAQTTLELVNEVAYLSNSRPIHITEKAQKTLSPDAKDLIKHVRQRLEKTPWEHAALEAALKDFVTSQGLKMGQVFQPLRAALTGGLPSPGVYDILIGLGSEESLARLQDQENT